MKGLIKQILNEETSQEKLARSYLSKLRLTPWKNDRYSMLYLATNKGTIIFLIDENDSEITIKDSIYDLLMKFLKNEDNVSNFVYDYIIEIGVKLPFDKVRAWVSRSENVGFIEHDDDPYFDSNSLNENTNPVKNYWTKKWSKQKEKGEAPSLSDIQKLGFSKKRNEIIQYFAEFMGYDDENSKSNAVKQYLLNHTFTEKEITDMDNFDQGKITVKFTKVDFIENVGPANDFDLNAYFVVLNGSFYNSEDDETYDFSTGNNPFDDFVTYFEFKEGIDQVVEGFVHATLESFGFNINNDFDDINVKW